MKYLIWTIVLFLLLVLQGGVLTPWDFGDASLLLLAVIISLLFSDFDFALFLTIVSGVMLDFVSGAQGLTLLSMILTFLLMYFVIHRVLDRDASFMIIFSLVAGGTIGYFLMYLVSNELMGIFSETISIDLRSYFASQLPKSLAWNLLFTYPIYQIFLRVEYINQMFAKHES